MMLHVQNAVVEMVAGWNADGFRGVRFSDCYVQLQEFSPGDQSQEEFDAWVEGYACFVAQPDLSCDYEPSNEFETVEVDSTGFHQLLLAEINARLGSDVVIEYRGGCSEFEVSRV